MLTNLFTRSIGGGTISATKTRTALGFDAWPDLTDAQGSVSGVAVTPESARRNAAVYACTRVISEGLGVLPLRVVKRQKNGGVEIQMRHPVDKLLWNRPNMVQSPSAWKQLLATCQILRGNAWVFILRNRMGQPIGLFPLMPGRVIYERKKGYTTEYEEDIRVTDDEGHEFKVDPEDILHFAHLQFDETGLGLSPISAAISPVALGIAAEKAAELFYGKGWRQSAVISHPELLKKGTFKRLQDELSDKYSGIVDKGMGVVFLDEGMTYDQVGMTAHDSMLLEAIQATDRRICAIMRVPPPKVMDLTEAHYNNVEHLNIDLNVDTLLPLATSWEEEMTQKLLTEQERDMGYEVWFNFHSVIRADLKSQTDDFAKGMNYGWHDVNTILGLRGQPPVEHGELRFRPVNLVELGKDPPAPATGAGGTGSGFGKTDKEKNSGKK